jgi:hypothetical protein
MRITIAALAITLLWPSYALAQRSPSGDQTATPAASSSAQDEAAEQWVFSAAVYFYQVVDERNYAQPTLTADRGRLHLEARYNYEDLETASLWLGYNMSGGETVAWEITPMFGGVFGLTDAVAPGYKGSLGWRALEFYSEGEYVFDTGDASDRFFYNWSEFTVALAPWWRVGLVTQRTRVYQTERDIQRGLLVGFSYKALDSTLSVFNPDDSHPIVVFSAAVEF